MFIIRPYRESDRDDCGLCLYEGFFTVPINENDRKLLDDYAGMLAHLSSFTLVAEYEGRVVGFVSGFYFKEFRKKEKKRVLGKLLKYLVGGYHLSPDFSRAFKTFIRQARERDKKTFGHCDLELQTLVSRRDYRKGLGTSLVNAFFARGREDGASVIRLFTNTLVSWQFYEKRGFKRVAEKPFRDGSGELSLVYEYLL